MSISHWRQRTITRRLARLLSSRRSFLARLGVAAAAAPVLPLLPVSRAAAAEAPRPTSSAMRRPRIR